MIVELAQLFDGTPTKRLVADEGMTCVRTADGLDFGSEVLLGYRYRDYNGNVLDAPILELPEDFHEEEAPIIEEEEGGMA